MLDYQRNCVSFFHENAQIDVNNVRSTEGSETEDNEEINNKSSKPSCSSAQDTRENEYIPKWRKNILSSYLNLRNM